MDYLRRLNPAGLDDAIGHLFSTELAAIIVANGEAVRGLLSVVEQAEATTVGVGIVIEKGFQHGGQELRENGVRLESLAIIDSMDTDHIRFR